MLKYLKSPLSAAILRTFSKWGGPVRAFYGGASLETFSGEAQLKKSPCIITITTLTINRTKAESNKDEEQMIHKLSIFEQIYTLGNRDISFQA